MARSKAARVAHRTKRTQKKKPTPGGGNIFEALELEEPYEYFPLLDLPRELRDAILDYMFLVDATLIKTPDYSTLAILDTTIDSCGDSTTLITQPSRFEFPIQARGSLAMLLVNKRASEEFKGAIARTMPHHIRAGLMGYTDDGGVVIRRNKIRSLPRTARRVYLQNVRIDAGRCCLDGARVEPQLLDGTGWAPFSQYLRKSTTLTELVIDWCLRAPVSHYAHPPSHQFHDLTVEVVESLPSLKQYCIRGCSFLTYAQRRKGEEWRREEKTRHDWMYDSQSEERWKFLVDMGVDYDW